MDILKFLIPLMILVVFGILVSGIVVMARGGDISKKYSNKLMQARVLAQFAVVILVALLLFLSNKS